MSENTNFAQQNLVNKILEKNKKSRNKKIAIIAGIIFVAIGFFAYPKIVKLFDKKEIVCLKNQTEIYEKYKDAVVLVEHTYAYEVRIKGSKPFVISASGSENDEKTVTGTGFFVSQDGKIVTNHHVAEPWNASNIIGNSETYIKQRISEILPDSIAETEYKKYLDTNWYKYENEEGFDEEVEEGAVEKNINEVVTDNQTVDSTATTSENIETIQPEKIIKYVSIDDIEVRGISIKISVALHGSNNVWLPCKTLRVTDDYEIDVAVLQLESKELPTSVSNIIDLNTAINDDMAKKTWNKSSFNWLPNGNDPGKYPKRNKSSGL